jgi:hypothetical protein
VTGKIGMSASISFHGMIALAIRNIFQNGGNRCFFSAFGQPNPSRQTTPVRKGNPKVFNFSYPIGKGRNSFQRTISCAKDERDLTKLKRAAIIINKINDLGRDNSLAVCGING